MHDPDPIRLPDRFGNRGGTPSEPGGSIRTVIDSPRLDLLLAEYGRPIAIGLVVIGALALLASGWAVANPTTETTTQYADERVSSDLRTSAVVVQDGTLWNEGDRLENSEVYVLNATPELTVEPETRLVNETAGEPIADGEVTHELTMRFEATRDGEAFWNESHTVIDDAPTLENGVATSEATIDVESYRERQQDLERELSGVGSVDLEMALRVEYDTGTSQGTVQESTTVHLTEDAYWLAEPLSVSDDPTHRIGTEQTTESRNTALVAGLSLLGTLAIVAGAFVARREPIDEQAARRAVHERRYAEWISRGSLPMWIGDHHVSLETLEDVVDVAIDTNRRVVYDRERDLFAVVTGDVVYYYSDQGLWEETVRQGRNPEEGAADDEETRLSYDEHELEDSDVVDDTGDDVFDDGDSLEER